MKDPTMNRTTARPDWSTEEAALAESLRAGVKLSASAPLPDPDEIFLLSRALGREAPCRSLLARIFLSWSFLTFVAGLPIALWLALRWEAIAGGLPSSTSSSFLTSLARRLSEAGAPGWEAGAVLLCVLLFLYAERLLSPPRRE